ncbi:MAG: hypothetical protein IKE21_05645 [Erysipelotrichaceae bacterium]|nr:hypothetical protein [Erysipelotrichaceae bacterium]
MDTRTQIAVILGLILAALVIVLLLVRNMRATNIRKELDDIHVRFNTIKTVPLELKLRKATAMAKIDEELKTQVEDYYNKYDTAQKNLDQLQELIDGIEDSIAGRKYADAQRSIVIVRENLEDSEAEVKEIDRFLEQFVEKENEQRDYSNSLKEEFRALKDRIAAKQNEIAYSMEGIEEKLAHCEDLFSSSEEWMYGNEYASAQQDLDEIRDQIAKMDQSLEVLPGLLEDAKGVIPVLDDEVRRQYALSSQRGLYLAHLHIDSRLADDDAALKKDLSALLKGDTEGVREDLDRLRADLEEMLEKLKSENQAFAQLRKASESVHRAVDELARMENYLEVVCEKEKERYALSELAEILPVEKQNVERYQKRVADLDSKISGNMTASSTIIEEAGGLFEAIRKDREHLRGIKARVDDTATGESRARSQVVKLQLVLNEVEVKIAQYRLPAISTSYQEDLKKGHEYVARIKALLEEIPLNIETLNTTLDEAIDFIYRLYNNVNNVVGMAVMVENAIVFGNKYRSTYPEVDRELSRAEFAYLNGEYTQALKIALSSMKSLFPNGVDDKILENS